MKNKNSKKPKQSKTTANQVSQVISPSAPVVNSTAPANLSSNTTPQTAIVTSSVKEPSSAITPPNTQSIWRNRAFVYFRRLYMPIMLLIMVASAGYIVSKTNPPVSSLTTYSGEVSTQQATQVYNFTPALSGYMLTTKRRDTPGKLKLSVQDNQGKVINKVTDKSPSDMIIRVDRGKTYQIVVENSSIVDNTPFTLRLDVSKKQILPEV